MLNYQEGIWRIQHVWIYQLCTQNISKYWFYPCKNRKHQKNWMIFPFDSSASPRLTSLSVIWVKRLQVSNADKAWTCSSCLAMFSWFKRISLISLQKMKVLSIQGCPRNALWITVSLTPASGTLGHDASPTFKVTATCPAIRTLLCYVSLCMKLYVCF